MTFGLTGAGLATANDDGLMPAAKFSALSGDAPSDTTADILTTTAHFTYQSGTGSVVSTLDGITLSFDWVYDEGCAAAASSWPRAMLALGGALLAVLASFAGDHRQEVPAVDPPEPDRPAVGPSVDVLTRVARGELSPEEGARTLEIGRERRPVDVVSFEDAVKATREQPKGEP